MKKPTIKRTSLALIYDALIVYITYIFIGVLGYLTFARAPLHDEILSYQNIFRTPHLLEWIPSKIYSLLFLSTTLTLILSCLFPIKMVILECLGHKDTRACRWNILASLMICIILAGFSIPIPTTSVAIRIIGVTFYPLMCFVMPSLFYISLKLKRTNCEKLTYMLSWVLLVSMLGFISTGILDIIKATS